MDACRTHFAACLLTIVNRVWVLLACQLSSLRSWQPCSQPQGLSQMWQGAVFPETILFTVVRFTSLYTVVLLILVWSALITTPHQPLHVLSTEHTDYWQYRCHGHNMVRSPTCATMDIMDISNVRFLPTANHSKHLFPIANHSNYGSDIAPIAPIVTTVINIELPSIYPF